MTHYKGEGKISSDMAQNPFHFLDQIYGILYPVTLNYHNFKYFKRKIKKWVPLQCPCRHGKIYLQHVRFIQWTPENSLHRNVGVPLSVSLINVWTNVCVCVCQFVHTDLRNTFWKDSISCSVTKLTSISSMLLL